ncbi:MULTISPECIES: Na+/H+ antiporter subunit G [Marinomonas]|uniref:Na+/H+ antiporter subunit G n=2 Tax=Marinomonas TaxID=28253 RepID=A0A7H1J4Z9_9GAMM|nr:MULTISPECIES: Na+/H+ antiporter subunit G [Marinomonas]MCS7486283.1 sodium:proton antiporter [Marinomonas sp. BSi20414]MCW4628736.1 Na+/H+ antiporter subunit G [Marinomonas sp. KJ51-3]QNT05565.1 Na+/H+ antiporter subunit G [Marinomonas arctica]GGN30186.1 monovalent cation/H+ antiporter subunit G [Marinomonas arctica]
MPFYLEIIICVSLLTGGAFLLIGSYGLVRLPDIYMRLHSPTKASTLGITGVLVASMIFQSHLKGFLSIQELLITLFLLITAPVAANMIAKTALHFRTKPIDKTQGQELMETIRDRKSTKPPHTPR